MAIGQQAGEKHALHAVVGITGDIAVINTIHIRLGQATPQEVVVEEAKVAVVTEA
ncbi:hypothetical protein [Lacihabitans lacunae]|uniref:Uncharacterized protein n=1 Tax=Lacihabitans lacunae TaxID=1028214 RepID=A0ABV7YX02_9BACT